MGKFWGRCEKVCWGVGEVRGMWEEMYSNLTHCKSNALVIPPNLTHLLYRQEQRQYYQSLKFYAMARKQQRAILSSIWVYGSMKILRLMCI